MQQLGSKWRGRQRCKGQRNLRCRGKEGRKGEALLSVHFAIPYVSRRMGLERWRSPSLIHPKLKREISHSKVSLHIYASWSLSLPLSLSSPLSRSILSDKLLISRRENNTLNTKQFEERAERRELKSLQPLLLSPFLYFFLSKVE